jgi:hypothetical protein
VGRVRPTANPSAPHSNRLAMRKGAKCTQAKRTAKYPKRIAALTGAKHVYGDRYRLAAGRLHFLVDSKFVRVISHVAESARFPVAADPKIPNAQAAASALLGITQDRLRSGESGRRIRSRRMVLSLVMNIN